MQSSCSRRQILIVGLGSAIVASVGGCANFLPPKSCRVVLGDVGAHGRCSVWTRK